MLEYAERGWRLQRLTDVSRIKLVVSGDGDKNSQVG